MREASKSTSSQELGGWVPQRTESLLHYPMEGPSKNPESFLLLFLVQPSSLTHQIEINTFRPHGCLPTDLPDGRFITTFLYFIYTLFTGRVVAR